MIDRKGIFNMAVAPFTHESFVTTTRGLRRDIPPMRLFEKAKKLGVWNPADLDFSKDANDWKRLNENQHQYVLQLLSQFISGEEAVTLDLLPLIQAVSRGGHLEEEMFLTTFLWEEAKHIDFFDRAMASWEGDFSNLDQYHPEVYKKLFYETLPNRMNALIDDPSPANLVRASTTYNLGIEGILAESGYFAWYSIMDENNILPGMKQGVRNLQLDESRHIAYGVFLLSRLISEDDSLFEIIQEIMDEMLEYLNESSAQTEALVGPIPFSFDYEDVNNFGLGQYQKRMARIEKARGKSLEEIYQSENALIAADLE